MKSEKIQQSVTEAFGAQWLRSVRPNIVIYSLLESTKEAKANSDMDLLLDAVNGVTNLYPEVDIIQHVFLCPEELYVERFKEKAVRFNFDPTPWISWSEGDIDVLGNIGRVFCIRQGANFKSVGDQIRFYQHELGHPFTSKQVPLFGELLADNEGLVEADSRVALATQQRQDMQFSSEFIVAQSVDELPTAAEINKTGYDHPSFIDKTVSLNPGYVATFLWFFGQSLKIAELSGFAGSVTKMYLHGRKLLIQAASQSKDKAEYFSKIQSLYGFDYIAESESNELLLEAQNKFRDEFLRK